MRTIYFTLFCMLLVSLSLQGQTTIFSENFEGDVSAWNFGTTGQTNRWFCGYATSYNGSKSAYISSNGGTGATYSKTSASTSWLEISVDLTEFSSADLTFYWKSNGQGGAIPNDYGEVYVNSLPVSSLREYVGVSTWTYEPGINLSAYSGEVITLRFKWVNNSSIGSDPPFCVDDILITGEYGHDFSTLSFAQDNRSMQDMTVYAGQTIPFNVVAKNVGTITESSPIKWTCDGGTPTSDSDESTIILAPGETANHLFSPEWTAPITPGDYTLQFFTDLEHDTDSSNDLTSITITVIEPQEIPYSQNFDSTISPSIPDNWTRENANNDGYSWMTNTPHPRSPLNQISIHGNAVRQMDDWLFSCPLQLIGGETYKLSFWSAISDENDTHNLEIFYGEFPTSASMTSSSIFDGAITSVDYEEKSCYLSPSSSGVYYIGWHGNSSANSSILFIDDIHIKQTYNHDFATLSFEDDARSMRNMVVAPNTEMNFYITVRNEGFTTESSPISWSTTAGEPVIHSENSSILSQGQSEKYIFTTAWTSPSVPGNYTIHFFTDLSGEQDSGNDLTSIIITVSEPGSIPYSQNFDDVLAPDLPSGWSVENSNRDYKNWINSEENAPFSEPNHMIIFENPYVDMNDWVFSCPLALEAGKFYDLSFYYYTGGLTQSIEVKWGTLAHSAGMTLGTLFTDTLGNNDIAYHEGTATFSPTEDGVYYLGWRGFTEAAGWVSSNLFIDEVTITEQDFHDFGVLSYEDDNRSIADLTVLINESVQFNVVVKNFGSYTESTPIKWNCTGGTPVSDSDEVTNTLAPDETENHIFSPNWTAPSIPGYYNVTFYTEHPSDTNFSNDSVIIEIHVIDICSGLPIVEDFETGLDIFANDAANNVNWQINSALYHSGGQSAWNYTTANNDNRLIQQCSMDLTSYDSPHLSFYHIAKTEAARDKGFVEVSTDLGENWTTLTGTEYFGASEQFNLNGYFDETCYENWGTGSEVPENDWWKQEIFDLSAFKTESSLLLRFRLESNSTVNRYGWLLDDISILELSTPYAAYHPTPEHEDDSIYACLPKISWENGFGTDYVDVYLSDNYNYVNTLNASAKVVSNQDVNEYMMQECLNFGTSYFWRIVSKNGNGSTNGDIWSFITMPGSTSRLEDFESGDFSEFSWQLSGDADWFVQSSTTLEGSYSAQSGTIGNNQASHLIIEQNITASDYISFNVKTDTEENYDKLIFYIDGEEKGSWSGVTETTSVSFYVESGLRTFQWTYQKNVTGASGVDAVWLDCISFPPFDSGAIDSPTNLTLVISGNNIELNWDSVDGADSYNVYRSTEPTGTFDFIQSTGENSYIDSNALLSGTNYFYRVTAVNSAK